jgi:hypothetical protein
MCGTGLNSRDSCGHRIPVKCGQPRILLPSSRGSRGGNAPDRNSFTALISARRSSSFLKFCRCSCFPIYHSASAWTEKESILMKIPAAWIVVLIACSSSLFGQWPKFNEAGVPRDAQGRMVMEGRTPRTPDGKPDLSGDWMRADRRNLLESRRHEVKPIAVFPLRGRLRRFLRIRTHRLLLRSSTSARTFRGACRSCPGRRS